MLPEALSEALGVSLSKVHDLYFGDLYKVRRSRIIEEAVDHWQKERQWEEERRVDDETECCLDLQSYREDTAF
jgi:hypothetical protein